MLCEELAECNIVMVIRSRERPEKRETILMEKAKIYRELVH